MAKNYYAILGILSNAKAGEIKAAYRSLTKEFHPDNFRGGSDIFQQIQEAYSILSDVQKRRQYDQNLIYGKTNVSLGNKFSTEKELSLPDKPLSEIDNISIVRSFQTFTPSFDEIFDWLWNNFSTYNYPKSGCVQNLTIEVPLSKEQALSGGNVRIMVPARAICKTCRGYGNVGPYECSRCAGEGAITGEVPIIVAFQPGLKRNQAVMIPLDRYGIRNLHLTVLFCPSDVY